MTSSQRQPLADEMLVKLKDLAKKLLIQLVHLPLIEIRAIKNPVAIHERVVKEFCSYVILSWRNLDDEVINKYLNQILPEKNSQNEELKNLIKLNIKIHSSFLLRIERLQNSLKDQYIPYFTQQVLPIQSYIELYHLNKTSRASYSDKLNSLISVLNMTITTTYPPKKLLDLLRENQIFMVSLLIDELSSLKIPNKNLLIYKLKLQSNLVSPNFSEIYHDIHTTLRISFRQTDVAQTLLKLILSYDKRSHILENCQDTHITVFNIPVRNVDYLNNDGIALLASWVKLTREQFQFLRVIEESRQQAIKDEIETQKRKAVDELKSKKPVPPCMTQNQHHASPFADSKINIDQTTLKYLLLLYHTIAKTHLEIKAPQKLIWANELIKLVEEAFHLFQSQDILNLQPIENAINQLNVTEIEFENLAFAQRIFAEFKEKIKESHAILNKEAKIKLFIDLINQFQFLANPHHQYRRRSTNESWADPLKNLVMVAINSYRTSGKLELLPIQAEFDKLYVRLVNNMLHKELKPEKTLEKAYLIFQQLQIVYQKTHSSLSISSSDHKETSKSSTMAIASRTQMNLSVSLEKKPEKVTKSDDLLKTISLQESHHQKTKAQIVEVISSMSPLGFMP